MFGGPSGQQPPPILAHHCGKLHRLCRAPESGQERDTDGRWEQLHSRFRGHRTGLPGTARKTGRRRPQGGGGSARGAAAGSVRQTRDLGLGPPRPCAAASLSRSSGSHCLASKSSHVDSKCQRTQARTHVLSPGATRGTGQRSAATRSFFSSETPMQTTNRPRVCA